MSKAYFNTLKAGPSVVNMKEKSPYLYENVLKINDYAVQEQKEETIPVFQNTLIDRLKNVIVPHSDNSTQNEQYGAAVKKLTNMEFELLKKHKSHRIAF